MGPHTNYHSLIYDLINLKHELYRVKTEKFQPLIEELSKYSIKPENEYDDTLPSHKALAEFFRIPQPRMNHMIKDLHMELIKDFGHSTLKINKYRIEVHIHFSYEEEEQWDRKKREYWWDKATILDIELPFVPRIGEEISFDFMHETDKFCSGYVHNVWHRIDGVRQEICIDVHPTKSFYYRWIQMKEKYEDWERWNRSG
jgi:hypothetical protein